MQHSIKSQRALYFSLLENPDLREANNSDGEISLGIGLAFLSPRSLRYSVSKRTPAKVLLNERAVSPLQVHPMNPERALPLRRVWNQCVASRTATGNERGRSTVPLSQARLAHFAKAFGVNSKLIVTLILPVTVALSIMEMDVQTVAERFAWREIYIIGFLVQ